ncbi:unnamed protein product [Clonostachys rosea]|uniref:Nephrocystin 3-like N-terminal domain-containing protein n=1 Tax=Bionectria ochroleuca TaxID=29856 RepID=A0ABY6UFI1_BIOOC|nr:unnamed protein product [Clonostachys rosea]
MSDSETYSEADAVIIDRDDVSNYNPGNMLPLPAEEIQMIREWLEPTPYAIVGGEYRKHLSSRAVGTGQWLTSTQEYKQWLQGDECGLLWIKGIPGSGKSVHAARLIDELGKTNPGCPVLYFFFRQIIAANHTPRALVRDWMDQVLKYSPPLQHQLFHYLKKEKMPLSSLSTSDLLKDLQMAFRGLPDKVFCVVDALDEMDTGNDAFLKALGLLSCSRPAKIKVLITSRPVARVETPLGQTPALHIRLEERLVDVDISTYVYSALSESHIPQEKWHIIMDAIPAQANGLFLYAKLAMDAFLEPGADLETVLAHLPTDLNVLYTDLLREHVRRSGVSPSFQQLILQAVTHASRPLRLLELAEMCRIVIPAGIDKDLRAKDLRSMKDLIRVACGPLLEILPDETISVIHHSFTEYLKGTTRSENGEGYAILQQGPSHAQLALSCLRYLLITHCLDEVESSIDDSREEPGCDTGETQRDWIPDSIIKLRIKFPFFVYATSNWHVHVRESEAASYPQDEINALIDQFIAVDDTRRAWLEVTWPGSVFNARKFSDLHIAGRYGLVAYTRELVARRPDDVDACDICGKTPLWWAASEGHARTVSELMIAGADPDHERKYTGHRPLHEAACKNHYEVIRVLLEAGIEPLAPVGVSEHDYYPYSSPSDKRSALAIACEKGFVEAVNEFLPYVDLDALHRGLSWAALEGQVGVVKLILPQTGIHVDTVVRGSTALFKACLKRNVATVEALIDAGANAALLHEAWESEFGSNSSQTRTKGSDGVYFQFSCLHALCGTVPGYPVPYYDWDDDDGCEIATLLIDAGVDIHHATNEGKTALHSIVGDSYYVAQLLIEAGASANARDTHGCTPLYYSSIPACVRLLVEEGDADINARDSCGNTPLLTAVVSYGHENRVLLLLDYGADTQILNSAGDSALHLAIKTHHATTTRIVEALLESGIHPNIRNRQGETPLMCTSSPNPDKKIWDVLLAGGADINARDRNGHSIFWHQVKQSLRYKNNKDGSSHDDVCFLLDHGASPHVWDLQGRTCLHEAIRRHDDYCYAHDSAHDQSGSRLDFLLEIGLDHLAVDKYGNSLLHELAAREGDRDPYGRDWVLPLWERLVHELHLDVDQQNSMGRTPLHILCDALSGDAERYLQDPEPMDFLLAQMNDIHVTDVAGLTALHVAVTRTEYCTFKLLEAGLDPRAITNEGTTPLHLAARAEQSNIVGMLVRALQESSTGHRSPHYLASGGPESVVEDGKDRIEGIDARDADGLTPLYYAVRSGRHETVAILLQAGADPNAGCDLFRACSEFEQENARLNVECGIYYDPLTLRESRRELSAREARDAKSYSTKSSRAKVSPGDTRRLEEIVKLLIDFGADASRIGKSDDDSYGVVGDCVRQGKAYTAACLMLNVPTSHWVEPGGTVPYGGFLFIGAAAYDPSLATKQNFPQPKPNNNGSPNFDLFIKTRQYRLVEELAERGARFLPDPRETFRVSHLSVLIEHGFYLLVREIGTIEAERALDEGDWHAFGDRSKPGLWCGYQSADETESEGKPTHRGHFDFTRIGKPFLLLEAVKREFLNIDIVKSLIEDFHVDVNERAWEDDYSGHGRGLAYGDSALHYVSRGYHWWHVYCALEYLLTVPSIQIDLRGKAGFTPLHSAIGNDVRCKKSRPHARDSARRLLKAGADIHALTEAGQSCLSLAVHDVQMVCLLLEHGAVVSPDDVVSAIEVGRVDVLQKLLDAGPGINGQRPELNLDPALRTAGQLFMKYDPDDQDHTVWGLPVDNQIVVRMIEMLIDHGANPLCHYMYCPGKKCGLPRPRWRPHLHFHKGLPFICPSPDHRQVTLLHDLVATVRDFQIRPFLVSGLNINHRDPDGRTILHGVCQKVDLLNRPYDQRQTSTADIQDESQEQETTFQHLVALGADVTAIDKRGQSVLVSLISATGWSAPTSGERKTLEALLHLAPELAHTADFCGDTPLIHAARAATCPAADTEPVKLLLSAGASPLVTNNKGENVLHMLAEDLGTAGLRELFRELVDRGVDVNQRSNTGETPLFRFAHRYPQTDGHRDRDWSKRRVRGDEYEEPREQGAIALLQELGADFSARDNEGRGLLHVAAADGGDALRYQELMAAGVDPMMEDHAQQTAIDVAAAFSNNAILEIFEKKARR